MIFTADDVKTNIIHNVRFLHVNKQTKHVKKTHIIGHPQNISFSSSLKCHSAEGSEDKCTLLLKCHSVKGKNVCMFQKKPHTAAGSERSLSRNRVQG